MDQHSQEEAVIVERFRRFQPRPSRKVFERMANMPWGKPIEREPIMQAISPSPRTKIAVAALVIVVLAGTAIWTTPAFRAFAQELLNTLFNRESSSTIVVAPMYSSTGDAGLTVTLTDVASVEILVGFHIKQPTVIPTGYLFAGVGYTGSRHAASLIYQRPGAEFSITQQLAEYSEYGLLTDGASGIGPDAPIENVQIGSVTGEYVAGSWIMRSDSHAVWQANAPVQRLRWQDGDMIYEILASGGSSDTGSGLDQNAIIALAVSLQ